MVVPKFYIATQNPFKLKVYRGLLAQLDIPRYKVEALSIDTDEVGYSFSENAKLKVFDARKHLYSHYGGSGIIIADDAGIAIPALGGYPGVFSKRIGRSMEERHNNITYAFHSVHPYHYKFWASLCCAISTYNMETQLYSSKYVQKDYIYDVNRVPEGDSYLGAMELFPDHVSEEDFSLEYSPRSQAFFSAMEKHGYFKRKT